MKATSETMGIWQHANRNRSRAAAGRSRAKDAQAGIDLGQGAEMRSKQNFRLQVRDGVLTMAGFDAQGFEVFTQPLETFLTWKRFDCFAPVYTALNTFCTSDGVGLTKQQFAAFKMVQAIGGQA